MRRAIAATVLTAWVCGPLHAQSAATRLEFEVATVKPAAQPGRGVIRLGSQGGPGSPDPGRVAYTFSTIRDLIVDAYGVKRNQVSGGPNWLDSDRFDIVAKVPAGATREQVKVMLQNLLAERFRLTLHRESRELPIYALVVSAKGPRLKESTVAETPPPPAGPRLGIGGMKLAPDGCPRIPPATRAGNFTVMTPNGECMISTAQTMDALAAQLSNRLDRPVIDQTGLHGPYDFRLRYDPLSMPGARGGPGMIKEAPGSAPDADAPPTIFNALQEQLGLKLESKKGPVELLVIDHVERKPAE